MRHLDRKPNATEKRCDAVLDIQVPAGTAIAMSVSTRALPRAGIVVALEAKIS